MSIRGLDAEFAAYAFTEPVAYTAQIVDAERADGGLLAAT